MSLKGGGLNGVLRSRVIGHRDPASFANSRWKCQYVVCILILASNTSTSQYQQYQYAIPPEQLLVVLQWYMCMHTRSSYCTRGVLCLPSLLVLLLLLFNRPPGSRLPRFHPDFPFMDTYSRVASMLRKIGQRREPGPTSEGTSEI